MNAKIMQENDTFFDAHYFHNVYSRVKSEFLDFNLPKNHSDGYPL